MSIVGSAPSRGRNHALAIWQAAWTAVRPESLIRNILTDPTLILLDAAAGARRILAVGCGKAGAAMSRGVEEALADHLDRVEGIVNVPADAVQPLRAIHLHAARPAGTNQPTPEGIEG